MLLLFYWGKLTFAEYFTEQIAKDVSRYDEPDSAIRAFEVMGSIDADTPLNTFYERFEAYTETGSGYSLPTDTVKLALIGENSHGSPVAEWV